MKLNWIIPLFAAAGLVLAGCGGGGSRTVASMTDTDTDTDPAPAPTPTAVTLPTQDNMYLTAAALELADTTDAIMIPAGGMHTVGVYTLSCSDAGACEVTIEGGEVMATGEVTAAYSTAAMTTIDDAKEVAAAEREDRATGLFSALTDATGTRGVQIRANEKNTDFNISRSVSGMAMVSDGGKSGWSTRAAPNALAGYQGTVLDNGKTQTYTVYTDIAAAKPTSFLTEYGTAAASDVNNLTGISVVAEAGTDTPNDAADDVAYHLTLSVAGIVSAAEAGLLDPTKFPQPKADGKGSTTYTYGSGDSHKVVRFAGTFHGASGTYECTATGTNTCGLSVTAPSTVAGPAYSVPSTATGTWTFTPSNLNNALIHKQDVDHMYFGWWIDTPTKPGVGGEYLYDAQVFYGGNSSMTDNDRIVALQGTADYSGPAAGLFAVTGDDAAHGEFTATANLTANFGGTTAGATGSEGGSIRGTIGSFVRDDDVANDWTLSLGAAGIVTTSGGTTNGSGSGSIVDGINRQGSWSFQLYGPATGDANPTGIAGAFNAAIDKTTAVAGAFATKP